MRYFSKIKRVPYLLWYSRHMLVHILIGMIYAWFLRELWGNFSFKNIIVAVIGSVIIDVDHFIYYFTYGRNEQYAQEVRKFLKQGLIGTYIRYCSANHKRNTSLLTHNVFILLFFIFLSGISFYYDWYARIVFFGAIVLHLIYDVVDDLWTLGYVNENWKRLRLKKRIKAPIELR